MAPTKPAAGRATEDTHETAAEAERQGIRRGPLRRVLVTALRVGLLATVLWLVWREVRGIDFRAAREQLRGAEERPVVLALLAAAAGIAVMGLYDVLAYSSKAAASGRRGPSAVSRWAIGALAFSWTNFLTLGPIGGPALRLYLYRRAGLDTGAIVRGLARAYCGMFGGLAGWVIASFLPFGYGAIAWRLIVALAIGPFLSLAAGWAAGRLRPVVIGGVGARRRGRGAEAGAAEAAAQPPFGAPARGSTRLYMGLGLVGVLDWGAALACFVLCGDALGAGIASTDQIRVVFIGHMVGLASMMPGGLGSADAVWLKLLAINGLGPSVAAAQIFLFRLVFYVAPWAVSVLGLYVYFSGRAPALMRWQRRVLAGAIAFNAIFLLASAATPAVRERLRIVGAVVPVDALEASHAVAVVAAAVMLFLVRGILRGYRAAFIVTGTLLAVSAAAHTLKGGDVEEAAASLLMLLLLAGARRAFSRRGRVPIGWELTLAAALGSVAFYLLVGMSAYRRAPYTPHLWTLVAERAEASRFVRSAVLIGCVGLAFLVRQAVRPRRRSIAATPREIEHAVAIIQGTAGHAAALNVACGDKGVWLWSPGGQPEGAVVYQERHGKMVIFSDPAAEERRIEAMLEDLHAHAAEEDLDLVFYQITGGFMQHLHDFGYTFFKLGEEAVVPLAGFSLSGGASHGYRKTLRRVEAEGVSFEVREPPHAPALIDECRGVSDEWLAGRGVQEMQFSVGYFSPAYLMRFPLAIARDGNGRLVAFMNILATRPRGPVLRGKAGRPSRGPSGAAAGGAGDPSLQGPAGSDQTSSPRGEVTFDLMRYRAGIDSLMDFMVLNLMVWAAQRGYERLNLGMSPLYDVGESRRAALPERLARLLFEHGERIYNYRGLHAFKSKFRPVWEPRFLAYQRPWDWPAAVFTTTSLIWGRGRRERERIARAREG